MMLSSHWQIVSRGMRLVARCGVGLLLLAGAAHGQIGPDGSIRGVVRDEQGAVLPGTKLVATSPDTPLTFEAVADETGSYRLLNMPPGIYSVTANLAGFGSSAYARIVVRAGMNVGFDIRLQPQSVTETVRVEAKAPLLETRSPSQTINISGEFQRRLPVMSRQNWSDFLALAPGITSWETSQVGQTQFFSSHGADSSANVLQLDGGDVGSLQASVNYMITLSTEAIADVQVKTAGVDAATPLGQGSVVNVVTQSGTNRLAGGATTTYQARGWSDSNVEGGTSAASTLRQVDLRGGGPLVADRAWIFGTYRYVDASTGIARTPDQLALANRLIEGFEPFDITGGGHFPFVKGTAQLRPTMQLQALYQRDVNLAESSINAVSARPNRQLVGGNSMSMTASGVLAGTTTFSLGLAYTDKAVDIDEIEGDVPAQPIYGGTLASGGRLTGVGFLGVKGAPTPSWQDSRYDKLTIRADATHLRRGFVGEHELGAGLYLQPRLNEEVVVSYVNGGFDLEELVTLDGGASLQGLRPFHREILDVDTATTARGKASDVGVYIQDVWRPHSRVTASLGLRLDWIRRQDDLFAVDTQRSLEVGPRVGARVQLSADGRTSARATWGRVHEGLSLSRLSLGATRVGRRDLYDMDLDGTFETELVTPASTARTPGRILDLDEWQQPHYDEVTAGFSHELPSAVTFHVDFTGRAYKDRLALVDVNGIYENERFTGYRDVSQNEIYQITNNRWNWPSYRALTFAVTRQSARVQFIASYSRQWRYLSGTWQPNDPAQFIQPDAFDNSRGIGEVRGSTSNPAEANSFSGSGMLPSSQGSQWHDHATRVGASIDGPWGVLLSSNYTFQSGPWSGPIYDRLAAPDPAFGPPTIVLSNGRVVSNPLATPVRFAYPTRTEGQYRLADYHAWNVRVGRAVRLPRAVLQVWLDLFNLTNNGADQGYVVGATQLFSATFGQGASRQLPRSAQVGFKITY